MTDIRLQIVLHTVNNVAEDFCTNSWCLTGDGVTAQTAVITPVFKDFYDDIVADLSSNLAQNGHEAKYYDLPGLTPNYPFDIDTWNLVSAPSGTPLPDEVAMCLSFQGEKAAGAPQNRRRGRVYIGPLDISWLNTDGRPIASRISNLTTAAATLSASLQALSPAVSLAVWSVTDQLAVPVTDGWVDNAWDTQRRRGKDATSRTTWLA